MSIILIFSLPVIYIICFNFQIREVPDDFFVDIVSSNNFLVSILTKFFSLINENRDTIDPNLRSKADRFKTNLQQKFNWDFDEDDLEEDQPVVVETE